MAHARTATDTTGRGVPPNRPVVHLLLVHLGLADQKIQRFGRSAATSSVSGACASACRAVLGFDGGKPRASEARAALQTTSRSLCGAPVNVVTNLRGRNRQRASAVFELRVSLLVATRQTAEEMAQLLAF